MSISGSDSVRWDDDPSSASDRCHGALVRRAARAACATPRESWAEAA